MAGSGRPPRASLRERLRKPVHRFLTDHLMLVLAVVLHETLAQVRDTLLSLIELHINSVSYDMNRVMKVLAVITALSAIPAVIGGLLGENLADSPYQLTVFEVAFLVLSLMLLGLYACWRRGWLR